MINSITYRYILDEHQYKQVALAWEWEALARTSAMKQKSIICFQTQPNSPADSIQILRNPHLKCRPHDQLHVFLVYNFSYSYYIYINYFLVLYIFFSNVFMKILIVLAKREKVHFQMSLGYSNISRTIKYFGEILCKKELKTFLFKEINDLHCFLSFLGKILCFNVLIYYISLSY